VPIPDAQIPVELHDRYGLPRSRRGLVIAGVLIAGLVVALMGGITHYISTHQVVGRLLSFAVVSDKRVTVVYYVAHAPTGPATCVLRAQDSKHVDVGYAYVTTQTSNFKTVVTTYPLTTSSRATTAEVLGCAAGTTPPRAAVPEFYPGQPAPPQLPPGRAPE
jgi:hypothetical protein